MPLKARVGGDGDDDAGADDDESAVHLSALQSGDDIIPARILAAAVGRVLLLTFCVRSIPMAEIKVEKKKPIWPWLLLLVLIAVLLIWFWAASDRENIEGAPATTDLKETSEPAPPAEAREKNIVVSDFITFVEEDGDRMGLDHVYTSEALVKLSEATRSVAENLNYNIQADLESVKEDASIITDDRQETVHANRLKNATGIITDALQEIQQTHYPDLAGNLAELRSASNAIRDDVLLLDQRTEVKSYFDQAAEILRDMTN